jgi:hypothetical protein
MSNPFPLEHQKLGDPHNYGKITTLRSDGKVIKRRNIAWERAFLSARSPLRQRIESICRAGGMSLPLPDLQYAALAEDGTAVDFISVQPAALLTDREVESLGAGIAVAVWFGMTDLSAENFVCGTLTSGVQKGNFCATPLDIESVLRPIPDLAATGLTDRKDGRPPHAALRSNAGLHSLHNLMARQAHTSAPAILIGAFSAMFSLLQQNRHDFTPLMMQLSDEPVRIFLRSTDFYRSILTRGPGAVRGTVGLLDEEVQQLLRGDIPWFFSLPGSDEICWFDRPESFRPVRVTPGSFPELKKLPRWPALSSQEDHVSLLQDCVQSLVGFFWSSHPLDAVHGGIQVRSNQSEIHIKSNGHYKSVE